MKSLADVHRIEGESFHQLYQLVTSNITSFQRRGELNSVTVEHPIVHFWVTEFMKLYDNWSNDQAAILTKIYRYQPNGKYHPLGSATILAELAFLHIAHDLPITIAKSLRLGQFSHYTQTVCDLAALKEIFNELEPALTEAIEGKWKKPWKINFLLSFQALELETIFTYWIVALRNKAWDDAMQIFCGVGKGGDPQTRLRDSVHKTMEKAANMRTSLFFKRVFKLRLMETLAFAANVATYFTTHNPFMITIAFLISLIVVYFFYKVAVYKSFKDLLNSLYDEDKGKSEMESLSGLRV